METIVEKPKQAGRPSNSKCRYLYKWHIIMFDKETNQMKEGKFCTISQLNEEWDLKLNSDYVKRIMTGYRADQKQRNGKNSFLHRYGHIRITKIHEPIN